MRRGGIACLLLTALLLLSGCAIGRYEPKDDGILWHIPEKLEEYRELRKENYEVLREVTLEEMERILEEKKSCYILLSFPGCENCQSIIDGLASYARSRDIALYYLDPSECLKDETTYKRALELLDEVLRTNEAGEKRIYTPELIEIREGEFGRYFIGSDEEGLKVVLDD